MLDDSPRSASVIAVTDCKCLALAKLDFLDELQKDADMAIAMLKTLAARHRRLVSNL